MLWRVSAVHQPGIAAVYTEQVAITHAKRSCKAQMLSNHVFDLRCLLLKSPGQHWGDAELPAAESVAAESRVLAVVSPVAAAEPLAAELLVAGAESCVGSAGKGDEEPAEHPAAESPVTPGEQLAAVLLVSAADLCVAPAGAGGAEPAESPAAESLVTVAVSHATAAEPLPAELLVAAAEIPAEPPAAAAEPWYELLVAAAEEPAVPAATAVHFDAPADWVAAAEGHTEPVVAQMEAAYGNRGIAEQADEAAGLPEAVEGDESAVAAAEEAAGEATE